MIANINAEVGVVACLLHVILGADVGSPVEHIITTSYHQAAQTHQQLCIPTADP